MIRLFAHDLGWIRGPEDDPSDLCAHGRVELVVDGHAIVKPEDGVLTVSAAALFLLRALTDDHTAETPVSESNYLFPCCGFTAWLCGERYPMMCMGCNYGIDVWIRHRGSRVTLTSDNRERVVQASEWRDAVLGFVRQIEDFYARCEAKTEPCDPHDQAGWAAFWSEWRDRCEVARRGET